MPTSTVLIPGFIQMRLENPSYPSMRVAVRVPSLGFHFSPARYHRLMQVAKIFVENNKNAEPLRPWKQADFEGWLFLLTWKVATSWFSGFSFYCCSKFSAFGS